MCGYVGKCNPVSMSLCNHYVQCALYVFTNTSGVFVALHGLFVYVCVDNVDILSGYHFTEVMEFFFSTKYTSLGANLPCIGCSETAPLTTKINLSLHAHLFIITWSSLSGITNTVGRILAGFMADLKWVNTLALHNVALLAAGVSCVLNMFANTYVTMCIFCAGFGLCVGKFKVRDLFSAVVKM